MSVMPGHEVEVIDLTEIVESLEIPCDFAENFYDCPNGPARWVAWRVTCACGFNGGARLICTYCKDLLMMSNDAIKCQQDSCDVLYQPARTIVSSIEPLDRRP